jgi:hypothetical protein
MRAEHDLRTRLRARVGLPRPSRTGPREPRAPPATFRSETHGQPSATPDARSPVLDRMSADVAELARGARTRPARHRGALASRMAPPTMDTAFGADSCGPPEYRRRHSHAGEQDGRRQSALGSASDPWRVEHRRRRGIGANRLAAPTAIASSAIPDVADLLDESRRDARVDGRLYRSNPYRPNPVRVCAARAPPPPDRPRQCYGAPDG